MAKLPLELSGFKKVASDKNTTTLKHPAGHTIKIAHNALSPKMRGQLASMKHFDEGSSNVSNAPNPNHDEAYQQGAARSSDWIQNIKDSFKHYPEPTPKASPKVQNYDNGGDISNDNVPADADYSKRIKQQKAPSNGSPGIDPDKAKEMQDSAMSAGWSQAKSYLGLSNGGKVANYDDGSADVSSSDGTDQSQAPVKIDINNTTPPDERFANPNYADQTPQPPLNGTPGSPTMPASVPGPAQAPSANPIQPPKQPQQPQQVSQQIMPPGATSTAGLDTEIGGYNQLGQAQAGLANAELPVYNKAAADNAHIATQFQDKNQDIQGEYNNAIQDYKDQHIDVDKYWENHSKLQTGIGLILGGIGGGGQGNQALDFLNRNIDRNIDAQRAEMSQKANLLTAYEHKFGNNIDATNMVRAINTGIVADKINAAAAKFGSPAAMARAQIATGPLIQQKDQLMSQIALRQTLMNGNVRGIDPAQVVPYTVPAEHQKDVLTEIGKAQNATQNEQTIMQQFDKAAQENTIANRIGHAGFNPGSVLQLNALSLPLIHDAEGRVNEYEAKTLHDLTPSPFDSDEKVAAKRQGYLNFIHSKQAAPMAKSYGIDLQRFNSTSSNPVDRMPQQHQDIVNWAKRNPNDPRSAIALKKLGVN